MDEWLREHLVCPIDHLKFRYEERAVSCLEGHRFPVVGGIPVLLVREAEPTHAECDRSLREAEEQARSPQRGDRTAADGSGIDPFVQKIIAGTCGIMYIPLIGKLTRYPIPDLPLPAGRGEHLLEIGCNWGRWCISAKRKGYWPVGIDPSLEAIQAAERVARQTGEDVSYLVADARHLPFADGCFDVAFSYSVFQHFSQENFQASVKEIARAVRRPGRSLIQMPNRYGPVNLIFQLMRGRKAAAGFDIRYWKPSDLERLLEETLGPTRSFVDGYFSLNSQRSDIDLLPPVYKGVVAASEMLKWISRRIELLKIFADSLYFESAVE
jgi:SAM-dependent methyltransferase/uncharacterized protein YbaR (Trm112 family)